MGLFSDLYFNLNFVLLNWFVHILLLFLYNFVIKDYDNTFWHMIYEFQIIYIYIYTDHESSQGL